MAGRREIDERDIDKLLSALSDRQIAQLFDMPEKEVYKLRQSRRQSLQSGDKNSWPGPKI